MSSERLYYTDAYLVEFDAVVRDVLQQGDRWKVVLDRTAFYPTSGGQPFDIGTLDELRVIAAAVIGGTALSGGIGTIHGAILGALVMQSLQSGMAMVGVESPYQNIVVGLVLVIAVWIDIQYRKRSGAK